MPLLVYYYAFFVMFLIIIDQLVNVNFKDESSQLPKMDNFTIKDKMPAPKLSVIEKFHCS